MIDNRLSSDYKIDMKRLSPIVEQHREEIVRIAKEYGFINVRIFGSMARGEDTPESDIDMVVDLDPERTKKGLITLRFPDEVKKLTNREVQFTTEDSLHPSLKDKILEECIPL